MDPSSTGFCVGCYTVTMTLQQFFKFAGIVTLGLGVAFMLFPESMLMLLYGRSSPDLGFTRYLGTALTGFGVANWYGARFALKPDVALVALTANFTSLLLASGLDLLELLDSRSPMGALPVFLLHAGFALGFGYFINETRTRMRA